jgi:hypothetical protein
MPFVDKAGNVGSPKCEQWSHCVARCERDRCVSPHLGAIGGAVITTNPNGVRTP